MWFEMGSHVMMAACSERYSCELCFIDVKICSVPRNGVSCLSGVMS